MIKEIRIIYENDKIERLEFFVKKENEDIILYVGNHEFAFTELKGNNENEIIENAKNDVINKII